MTSMTMVTGPVTGGVDTHGQTHHAAAIDQVGRQLGDREFPATPAGYRTLLAWLCGHGRVERVGVEGTGAYGAGLARHLRAADIRVVEVDRPDRQGRRSHGKSDPLDAYAAARAALAGTASGAPKTRDGRVEAIRALRVARCGAIKARTQSTNQLKSLLVTAPAELREQLRQLSTTALIATCARLRPTSALGDPEQATKTALRRLARRHQHLNEEITEADAELRALVNTAAPRLLALPGVGVEVAGQLLTSAGDNPDRLRSEAAFAHLCGASPRSQPAAAAHTAIGSTAAATAPRTVPSTPSCWFGSATTNAPAPTPPGALRRACPSARSCAASNATWPERSTPPCNPPASKRILLRRLDNL